MNNRIRVVFEPPTLLWAGGLFFTDSSGESSVMEVKLFVGNVPRSMTGKELDTLFAQAGDVIVVNIITDRLTGASKGFAFVTMSAQSEADKAVSMFNTYSLDDHQLKVALAKPREQRGFRTAY
jgi:RNA recognition motif-containing protein